MHHLSRMRSTQCRQVNTVSRMSARARTTTAKSWLTEAPLRMLMNNLDPEVAENPTNWWCTAALAAPRNWECYDAIVKALTELEHDETLLVQSGKPVGVFKTHKNAPRVLIANPTWSHTGRPGTL